MDCAVYARYHSLTHLQQMLSELDGHREQIGDMDKLELATFFHE
jgi:predicted metal-dependent HD superfamily phosphohydrolase